MSKLDLKAEMKPYIILDKEYGVSYVTSVGCSSGSLAENCVHTKPKLYDFYSKDKKCDIVFVEDALEHPHFIDLIKSLIEKEQYLTQQLKRTKLELTEAASALRLKG